jgi:preprotein translocase subunit Sss1
MSDNRTAGGSVIAAAHAGGYWKEIALMAVLIAAGVFGYSWLKAHDAWMRFQIESQLKHQQIALRDKQAAADKQAIEALKKQTQTPQQIVREIPKVINLPAPVQESLVGSRSLLANDQRQTTKDPSPQALPEAPTPQQTGLWFPPADVKPLFDRLADCKAMESQLSACRQNYLDMKNERDLAVKARRGSFWQRAKQIGIGIAIGGAIGYAAHR